MNPTTSATKLARQAISVVGGFLLFLALMIGAIFYAAIPWHNLSFWRMDHALSQSIKQPEDSYLLERHQFFGSRYTDTSECTYVVGEIRSTHLTPEKISRSYAGTSINLLGFAPNMPLEIVVIENDTSLPLDNPADSWIQTFRENVGVSASGVTYYLAYFYEHGRSWWGDFRCYE